MKIGLVCPYSLFSPGGVREHVLALSKEFKSRGHLAKIMAPKTKAVKNPEFILLGRSTQCPSATGSWGRISACFENKEVEEILSREKFDIIHFHEPLAPFLSWQILLSSQAINIATFHSSWEDEKSLIANFQFLIRPFAEMFEARLNGLIAVSEVAKKCWQKFFKKEMVIIPNGINLGRFSPQIKPFAKYRDGKINILFIGRLEKRKGIIYLLRAFAKMKRKDVRLILVGSGPRRIEAEILVRSHHLENVEFVGRVSDAALPRYYATADVCCFPSIGGESFGIVLLEAMASGKPVACFANPGYREVLKSYPFKKALVKIGDVEGLARVLGILSEKVDLRKKLSHWGLKEVKKYSWKKVNQQILDCYQKILPELSCP